MFVHHSTLTFLSNSIIGNCLSFHSHFSRKVSNKFRVFLLIPWFQPALISYIVDMMLSSSYPLKDPHCHLHHHYQYQYIHLLLSTPVPDHSGLLWLCNHVSPLLRLARAGTHACWRWVTCYCLLSLLSALLRYESSTLILYKELSSSIFPL